MKLSVACNFDKSFIDRAKEYPVAEIFGKLPSDFLGGGRSSYMLSPLKKKELEEYVKKCNENSIGFNYLLNASCLNNVEFTRKGQKEINKILDWLTRIGVYSVTIATPFLLQIIKARYPHFKTRVSVYACVDHVLKAKRWEDLGADCITLDSMLVNREFELLRNLRKKVKIDLQLMVNNSCMQSCAMCHYHNTTLAHSSQSKSKNKGFIIDFCYLKCSYQKLMDPVNYLRTDWIRPEDLHYYEEMGYDNFKIVERNAPTDILLTRVKAYTERKFDGNLLDLVQPFSYKKTEESTKHYKRRFFWELKHFLRPRLVNTRRLMDVKRLTKTRGMLTPLDGKPPVYLDNRKLEGFIEHFVKNGGCRKKDCDECRYCHEFADRAIKVDERHREECRELYDRIFDNLLSGKMWGLKKKASEKWEPQTLKF